MNDGTHLINGARGWLNRDPLGGPRPLPEATGILENELMPFEFAGGAKMSKRVVIFIVLGLVFLTQIASAFYDANLGRWLNRDPAAEHGFHVLRQRAPTVNADGPNLYTFVRNMPTSAIDPVGLKLWVCTSPAFGIIGVNHAYMWDDRPGIPPKDRECSMQSSSGKGGTHDGGAIGPSPISAQIFDTWYGPPDSGVTCKKIPNSDGKEDDAKNCCRGKANNGIWFPGLNDCHNPLDKCLEDAGIPPEDIPPHPRFGIIE